MEPAAYIPAYLEREYLRAHPELTDAARAFVHEEVYAHPDRYATPPHAKTLMAYADVRNHVLSEFERLEDVSDEEFEQRQTCLFDEARLALAAICKQDQMCVDAQLVNILLADVSLDMCLNDLLALEQNVREYLQGAVKGFNPEAPHLWSEADLYRTGDTAAARTPAEPEVVGWLHTLEALSQLCLASARYTPGAQYARQVMRAEGYPNEAIGTLLLALARLEDEDGFFAAVDATEHENSASSLEDSPWYLLARTLLLYKLGRRKNAARALRDFAIRCDGGAFFLLNPTYLTPYLPVRPPVHEAWKRSHQAVWEADGIISDTPDFALWAAEVRDVYDISENFARRLGFS